MDRPVRLEFADGVGQVVLASPENANSLDRETAAALRDTVAAAAAQPGLRVLVLRAEGRHFCVGGDLKAFSSQGDRVGDYLFEVATAAHAALETLLALEVPVIVAVQGAAAGAGIGLALCGDVVVVERSTKLRLAYTAVGLSPDNGSSWLLPRLLGSRRATELMLTNRVVTGDEAVAWGLASEVVDDGSAASRAMEIAGRLAAASTDALQATKRLVRASVGCEELGRHLQLEAETISQLAQGAESRALVERFVNR